MTRILIVDDKEENLYLLRALLTGYGYEVDDARHGAEALVKARQARPHLIISDLLMPVMDGYTLLRHWKLDERLRQIPFVVYTATYTEAKDEELALNLGADSFIIKPTEPELFMASIQEVLAQRKDGSLTPARLPTGDDEVHLKQYSEALIRKLEEKTLQLEQANRTLEKDISERKRIEEALQRSTSLLRAAFEATADGILAVDNEGKVVAFNQRFVEMWNIPNSVMDTVDDRQLLGHVMGQLKDPDGFIAKVNALYNASAEESWDIVEFKDGRVFERFSKPKRRGEGIVGRVWDFRDITERKKNEVEHEKLQAQFIQAQKMESVGRLAGGIAHDFNNMLGIVIGYAELAMMRIGPNDPIYGELDEILKAAKRSAALVRQLLAFARCQTIEPRVLNVNSIIEESRKMLARLVGEDITIQFFPGYGLWRIKIDPAQVDQILANLSVNARDAILGAGEIIIETRNAVLDEAYCEGHRGFIPGEYVLLSFSDSGTGMEREVLEHIFEPFFTTKELGKGTGLGLSTIYGIAKQNNGFVNAYSEPGHGSTFRVYIPAHHDHDEAEEKERQIESPTLTGTETILVVEDDRRILGLTVKILERNGYTVIPAALPGEALVICEKHQGNIQLVISDAVMPSMNGKELHERIKKLKPSIRVLYMSGYTANVIAHRLVLPDGVRFIQKPFTVDALLKKVREVLG